jgi:hypothetical protein
MVMKNLQGKSGIWKLRQIGLIAFMCILGSCFVVSATAAGDWLPSITLKIEVLPNGTYNPQEICESRPLNLKFKYASSMIGTYSLRYLEYSVFNESESAPFFEDKINLTDNTLPNEIDVSPGIYIPTDSTRIRVSATLAYDSLINSSWQKSIAQAQREESITALIPATSMIEKTYERMRDGYIRRHLLEAGRGLSAVWLKEYEPCIDSKELLRHSRTQKVEGQTRVYVPWTYKCKGDQCGASVEENSDAIYGGDENPLLRGGLAMATFALEYLAFGNPVSLNHAMKLFEYVEKSEWRDPATGQLTGFFLRSRTPGNIHETTQRQYFYASVDEISGMSLGMLYLHQAISKAITDRPPGLNLDKVADVDLSILSLTRRLGNQLRNNFYIIVPLKKEGNTWAPIGLPVEFHKGWSGVYPFQWFFSRGFKLITGDDYTISSGLYQDLSDFIVYGGTIPHVSGDGEDVSLNDRLSTWSLGKVLESLAEQVSPYDLAIGSIQSLGITMYNVGNDWKFPIPCAPDKTVHIDEDMVKRFNYAMLLHVYQLAQLYAPSEDEEKGVELEMARLVNGILTSGEKTKLNIPGLYWDVYAGAVFFLTGVYLPDFFYEWICNDTPEVTIGSPGREIDTLDIYSAAVAVAYNLPRRYTDPDKYQEYWNGIFHALGNSPFGQTLPLGERDVNVIKPHNPDSKWGSAFCWEHYGPCIVSGGGCIDCIGDCKEGLGGNCETCCTDGLPDNLIDSKYQLSPPIDSMREGAGLDFLLPWSLLYAVSEDPTTDFMKQALHNYDGPYLQACTTNPVSLALANRGRSDVGFFSKCNATIPNKLATLDPTSASYNPSGGSGSVSVTSSSQCTWTATSNASWITITGIGSGSHGTVSYSVEVNPGAKRTGTMTIAGNTFTVSQDPAISFCTCYLDPRQGVSYGPSASTGNILKVITGGSNCAWTATSDVTWIRITNGESGAGSGKIYYQVNFNTGLERTGTITIKGKAFTKTFTVNQGASFCTYDINPSSVSSVYIGRTGSVAVTTPSGCTWTATSDAFWITVTGGSSGSGSGSVSYSVSANSGGVRTGTIFIDGRKLAKTFTVNQEAPPACTYSINPASAPYSSPGGNGSVAVTAPSGCAWTAKSNDTWITVTGGSSGSGNGTVSYSVEVNPGAKRTGTMTIAGKTFTVNQVDSSLLLSPDKGTVGTLLTITGSGFGVKKGAVFLKNASTKIVSWSESNITCTINKPMASGSYSILVKPKRVDPITIDAPFTMMIPEIVSVSPTADATAVISGNYFGSKKGKVYLENQDTGKKRNCKLVSWGMDSITFIVPKLTAGTYHLKVINKVGIAEAPLDFTVEPSP